MLKFHMFISIAVYTFSMPVLSAVYRCTDTDGNTGYSQSPCTGQQTEKELKITTGSGRFTGNSKVKVEPIICEEVKLISQSLFPAVRDKEDTSFVYNDFGGVSNISAPMSGIINYIATLRYHDKISANEVGNLAKQRCTSGEYGNITIDDLPDWETTGSRLIDSSVLDELVIKHNHLKDKQQYRTVCAQYDESLQIMSERLSKPMDELSRSRLEADKTMMEQYKKQNCE